MNEIEIRERFLSIRNALIVIFVWLIVLSALSGCVPRAERVLFKINTDVNYNYKLRAQKEFEGCRTLAEAKVRVLKKMGIPAVTVHGYARDKYAWDHMVCKAYLDGKWYAMDSQDPVVWEWNAWKKATYDYEFE
jgi:hypothetical protein